MRTRKSILLSAAAALAALVTTGCADARSEPPGGAPSADESPAPAVVDSILPIEEEVRRFREGVGEEATLLVGGASSRDELVADFITALQAADTATIVAGALTPAEFIDLYFPHTVYMRPPYQMDPAYIWFQMQNQGSRGLSRALNRYGGRDFTYDGYACPDEPALEGPNRVWEKCVVRVVGGAAAAELRLFGPIIERDGRYKFVMYGNGL